MKIGILTRRYGFNMGSTLQGLALLEFVKSLGHEAEVLNYDETSAHWKWKIRPFIDHLKYRLNLPIWRKERDYLTQRISQEIAFNSFEKQFINTSSDSLKSKSALGKAAKKYDKIIIGSDQIWNPNFFDPNYFGLFLPSEEKHKIIPYAPSLGISNINQIPEIEKVLIKTLPVLSCREREGANIISEISGKDVEVVLDPTLMVDSSFWNDIADKYKVKGIPEKYCLTYFLGNDIPNDEIMNQKNLHGIPSVHISIFNKSAKVESDLTLKDVGPGEFLYLVKNASNVLTDSFHCAIFSYIFNRNFTIFERFKKEDSRNENSRIYTLLKILGRESRLFRAGASDSEPSLNEMRESSKSYLIRNLK